MKITVMTTKNSWRRMLDATALIIVACCLSYGAGAQTSRPNQSGQTTTGVSPTGSAAQPAGRGSSAVLVSPEEDYRIGPNDVIDIKVENAPELTQTFRVTAAGTFLMPYIGRVSAAKKTTEELALLIADGLRGDYLKDPRVSVSVKEFNSRSFFIQGSVRSPGVFQIEGRPTMLELLTLAGGLTDTHGANAYIIRRLKTPATKEAEPGVVAKTVAATEPTGEAESTTEDRPKYELKSANINGLLRGRFDQDVLLEPGDIINIPPSDVFFVAGEVNAPGSFALKEGTTLQQAISLAQGTNYKAALSRGVIFRENASGKREELHIDIGAIMAGKKEDVTISANDIIMVPNSKTKTIGGALLRAFGMNSVARLPLP
jgi:polysaccharide export outer membrane protein